MSEINNTELNLKDTDSKNTDINLTPIIYDPSDYLCATAVANDDLKI